MSDLVKRLRGERVHFLADIDIRLEAADFIEAQAAHIRELEAELAPREARGVRVKPLMWVRADLSCWGEYADAGLLRYNLTWTYRDDPEVWFIMKCEHDQRVIYEGGDEDAAYQSAQADYERRILSALEPAPVTPAEAARDEQIMRAMHEEMCGCLKGTKPSSASVEANIERSTEALQRIRKKFAKPGVRLSIKKGVPRYSVDENNPGMFVRVLDGVTQRGHFVDGEFVALP